MRSGALPTPEDLRDYSFHRSFGAVTTNLPADFDIDAGLTMPDQGADGLYYGCTGYTQADNATDTDEQIYSPRFTYEKTCLIEGHPPTAGCQLRNSIKSTRVYGLKIEGESDEQASQHRRGDYYNVYDDGGMDWFDSFKSSVFINKRGVSVGSPFFAAWQGTQGILPDWVNYDGNPNNYSWHNYSIKGWKTINGTQYLMAKMWQGRHYGDNGWVYMSRPLINQVMAIRGSAAFTVASFDPKDTHTIQIDILQTVVSFLYRLLGLQRLA